MKKLAIILTAFCSCALLIGAGVPHAAMLGVSGSGERSGGGLGTASFVIGLVLMMLIIVRGRRIGLRTRKKYEENEQKAYSYKPRAERLDRDERVRTRISLDDMDFPSGFGGINDMEQLERNREMYNLYREITDDGGGWDDARR